MRLESPIAKLGYAALFTIALPLALIAWAKATPTVVHAPGIHSAPAGLALLATGLTLIALGMVALWRRGGGLPMNAFPPPHLVTTGIFAALPHPIYTGFVLCCIGVALITGSASGLWLVMPVTALACAALVLGYETPDLKRRFGATALNPLLPDESDDRPHFIFIARTYILVLLPWIALYEAFVMLGIPRDSISTYFGFESKIMVWQWSEIIYASTYIIVGVAPLLIRTSRALRSFMLRGWISMALIFPIYWAIPLIAPPRPFVADSVWGNLLHWERLADSPAASFPSYHVVWAFIAAIALGETRREKMLWCGWATLVSISCITTGSHSIIDVVAGLIAFLLICRAGEIWQVLLRMTEGIANSWREWNFGPIRIINHGSYAAIGVMTGMFILGSLLGPGSGPIVLSVFLSASAGAAIWAQIVEGSPALLRPLGFYGGLLGGCLGTLVAPAAGIPVWTALCALAVAAPIIQGVGRLRCLVQGCCHGCPVESVPGIRYTHPNSRVCRLSGWRGVPIHPTPLYSLLWNCAIALVLFRLLAIGTTTTMVAGIYLIFSGLGRFVEEAYRGEPQTAQIVGLRLYQWLAIACIVTGACFTAITSVPASPTLHFHTSALPVAILCGLLAWVVTAVDFPGSHRRLARLT